MSSSKPKAKQQPVAIAKLPAADEEGHSARGAGERKLRVRGHDLGGRELNPRPTAIFEELLELDFNGGESELEHAPDFSRSDQAVVLYTSNYN